jgi:hypothetical protein
MPVDASTRQCGGDAVPLSPKKSEEGFKLTVTAVVYGVGVAAHASRDIMFKIRKFQRFNFNLYHHYHHL